MPTARTVKNDDKTDTRSWSVRPWVKRYSTSVDVAYTTPNGVSLIGKSENVLRSPAGSAFKGRVQMIFTSPPFPLNRKKKYGNLQGDEFKDWLAGYAELFTSLLTPTGSIVIEMGNAWQAGLPVMSTLAIESLLAFKSAANLHLCQEFIWYNPAKLPTPAQWVTIERTRVKDAFTRLWWLSPTADPKADNRNVLVPYSKSMQSLLRTQKYNAGTRSSEHNISPTSFLKNNGGAIPPNVLTLSTPAENVLIGSNTHSSDPYHQYCRRRGLTPHPARMPSALAKFFISLCTDPKDLVLDPFAGSNTTGAASDELNRRWVSIEAERGYAQTGVGRFPATSIANGLANEREKSHG